MFAVRSGVVADDIIRTRCNSLQHAVHVNHNKTVADQLSARAKILRFSTVCDKQKCFGGTWCLHLHV
jgi:hypothetical protein